MPLLHALLLGVAIAAPLLAVSIVGLSAREPTLADRRRRSLRKAIRRWRLQQAAKPELVALAASWERR
jgi:hypothetical protein